MTIAASVVLTGCGVPNGNADRRDIEARTCRSVLARLGMPADKVDPDRFAEVLAEFRDSGLPYSTVQPFQRACRSFE